jgi:phosphoenolpyruvate-protein phosphotransferase (PTS system enzyme I)
MSNQPKGEKIYHGIAVSSGVCRGKVLVLHRARHVISRREIPADSVPAEIKRFEHILVRTRTQIKDVQRRVSENMSANEGDIFEAHLMILEDRVIIDEVLRMIREQRVTAEFAYHTVSDRYIAAMEQVEDEYLRERTADMKDLTGRVLDNLLEVRDAFDLKHISEPCILVAHDLSPSTTAQLNREFVLGFATDIGGKTSHTAIMARSLDIPAIVGLQRHHRHQSHGQDLVRVRPVGEEQGFAR